MKYTYDLPVYEEDDICSLDEYSELMAQKVHSKIENNKYNDVNIKKDISDIKREQATQNKNIENLQTNDNKQDELISKLKNALINVETEEAKSLHVTDANKFGQLSVEGNQKQETREGYSLIDFSSIGNGNLGGVSYSVENDIITLNGNYNVNYPHPINNIVNNIPKINSNFRFQIYPISGSCENTRIGIRFNYANGEQIDYIQDVVNSNNYVTKAMDLTELNTVGFFIAGRNDATFNNYKFKLMFIEGTEEKPYEQYGASPSPDYPSPIKCLGSNKNLLDLKAQSRNGITVTKNADDTLNITGTATVSGILALLNKNIVLKANKSYTFSVKKVSGQDMSNSIWFWNVTDSNSEITLTLSNNIRTFTFTKDTTLSALNISVNQGHVFDITLALKVEEGTEATSYSPYGQGSTEIKMKNADETQEKSYTLPIQQEMLSGDYFVKEADGWKEVHDWNKIESYNGESITTEYISTTGELTIGATIFYKTEQYKLPCTEEQIAVLEELNNLDLFEGVNNIITAEDIALLKLKYALDVKTYVDNKLNTINQQILEIAGGN